MGTRDNSERDGSEHHHVAVIALACRVPGAASPEEFWSIVERGADAITHFSQVDDDDPGAAPPPGQQYVPARGVLEGPDLFDADFFGYTPRDARITDPQQRILLECAFEALQRAGYESSDLRIGVYAGSGEPCYLRRNLLPNEELVRSVGEWKLAISNEKDHLAPLISYKLGLTGPSVGVQTSCSSSLVAIALARSALLAYDCELALAGGVSIQVPQDRGYYHQQGGHLSPDGRCRAFDADARGTVPGNGAGVVVLKRLADAVRDRDHIHAVILGAATNNDGNRKVGYVAPSVRGQVEVIVQAHRQADIAPGSIGLVEAHGTATEVGDRIEVSALEQAFAASTPAQCALGSVKTNIGHLDAAAGIAGFMKAVLAVEHAVIPPSIHFENPNPELARRDSVFYVPSTRRDWTTPSPRRAGVSSFGIGGTNAHVILEAPPAIVDERTGGPECTVLPISAEEADAAVSAAHELADHLRMHPALDLGDVGYTHAVGRRHRPYRISILASTPEQAAAELERVDRARLRRSEDFSPPVAFLFPGHGVQHEEMGHELYATEPVYRSRLDECAGWLEPHLGLDIRDVLHGEAGSDPARLLSHARTAHCALFAVEYALAELWISVGVTPDMVGGHSLGELTAATVARVFELPDAARLVATRARLLGTLPEGAMAAVSLNADELRHEYDLDARDISLAAVNSPRSCTVTGTPEAVATFEHWLGERSVRFVHLPVRQAAHSAAVEAVLDEFTAAVEAIPLQPPAIPLVSNVTGTWLEPSQATDPGYWASHLRKTVQFGPGVSTMLAAGLKVAVEIGPRQTLTNLARASIDPTVHSVVASMRSHDSTKTERGQLLSAYGATWQAGRAIDWLAVFGPNRRRVPLPTHPLNRESYWLGAPDRNVTKSAREVPASAKADETVNDRADDDDERRLLSICAELFGRPNIHPEETFIGAGGDSLLAVHLVARVREQLGVELSLEDVFRHESLHALAAYLGSAPPRAATIQPRRRERRDGRQPVLGKDPA